MPQRLKSGTSSQIAFILSPERGDEGVRVVKKENFSPEQSSDFEALDYLESERSEAEFFKDLETLLLEYLQKPSEYTALLSSEGRLTDHKGLSLVEMGEKAESKYSGTTRYDRIHAETDKSGLRGLEYFYNTGSEKMYLFWLCHQAQGKRVLVM